MRSVCADTGVRVEVPERPSHPPSAVRTTHDLCPQLLPDVAGYALLLRRASGHFLCSRLSRARSRCRRAHQLPRTWSKLFIKFLGF